MNPLLSSRISFRPPSDSRLSENEAPTKGSDDSDHHHDRLFLLTYFLVALMALFAGYFLGELSGQPSDDLRFGRPPAATNPRSFNP
ncbi:MAG TPA: hypothetical protein VLW52_08950 [Opitutaceae bacterium]|nr:hypothetical protein [Opitutaceae bacterium]